MATQGTGEDQGMRGATTANPTTPIGRPPTANLMAPPAPTPSGGQPARGSQGAQSSPSGHTIGAVLEPALKKQLRQTNPDSQVAATAEEIDVTLRDPLTDTENGEQEKTIAEVEEEVQRLKESEGAAS